MKNKSDIKIALFCGGRGSATIIHELLRWPNVQLTLIVNAYDDGLSTGALRGFVSQMLGPSDFRKNLSYLLNPFSEEQYALKNLLEYRLPSAINHQDMYHFIEVASIADDNHLLKPLYDLFEQLNHVLLQQVRQLLQVFLSYAKQNDAQFDFRDCSVGNLIFAGAYLQQQHNFNAAAKTMSQLVNSRAVLTNVSQSENRILIALKENGELLVNEASIVGPQSDVAIRRIFLLSQPLDLVAWRRYENASIDEKENWLLQQQGTLPDISVEANQALADADIILFGPGTQHSSLLPSYLIAHEAIKASPALVKAMVINLDADHDIQSLSASDLVDNALKYLHDEENVWLSMTHLLLDRHSSLQQHKLCLQDSYKNAVVIQDEFVNATNSKVHNGRAVVRQVLTVWETSLASQPKTVDIFIDIEKRSLAIESICEEFSEMDWQSHFTAVSLTVNHVHEDKLRSFSHVKKTQLDGVFPEIQYFTDWLLNGKSEYLVLLTGDGEYRFRDVMLAIKLLEQSHFGAVFGSRTQSRLQFRSSLQAAYGEKKILSFFSFLGSFVMSAILALRFGVIFSDPLTGFRLFRRSKLSHLTSELMSTKHPTPVAIAKFLIKNKIEIAELPVDYRIYAGFTDPYWRIRRGVKNLLSTFLRWPA